MTQLKVLGIKMVHLDKILREKDGQVSDLFFQLDSNGQDAAAELQSLHEQLKELIEQNEEMEQNKDAEINTLADILLEKGVHVSDLSTKIEGLKQEIQEKEKVLEETINIHKEEKQALTNNINKVAEKLLVMLLITNNLDKS